MSETPRPAIRLVFERQLPHLLLLVGLLAGTAYLADRPTFRAGELGGVKTGAWLATAVGLAVAHQVYVWLVWRTQLHLGLPTRLLGDRAFDVHTVLFTTLGLSRLVSVWVIAIANADTIDLPIGPRRVLAVVLAVPLVWTLISIERYFGFRRALGLDHFDPSYRTRPLVRRGIFRWTSNAMYTFGFLMLWIPALWWASAAAALAAGFNHAYIWVHWHCTEKPDIRRIYGPVERVGPAP